MKEPETQEGRAPWLLLIHQLPAKPAYQRVKTWRRLQGLGAVAIKNAVHALPAGEQAQEDFEWLLREIREGGGEALICEARLVDGLSDEEVQAMFNAAREADYDALAKEVRAFSEALGTEAAAADLRTRLARLKSNLAQISPSTSSARTAARPWTDSSWALSRDWMRRQTWCDPCRATHRRTVVRRAAKRVWVTRQGVYIDRIASAWLIRRFIDPEARFRFVRAKNHVPQPGELRFDMFEAEFTHEGDHCTFSTARAAGPERYGADGHRRDRARHRPQGHEIQPRGNRRHRAFGHGPLPCHQGRHAATRTRNWRVRQPLRVFSEAARLMVTGDAWWRLLPP